MDFEDMKKMLETHCCARCEAPLELVWDGENDTYKLVCGTDHSHPGIKKRLSPTTALARGELDKVVGPGWQEDMQKLAERKPSRFNFLPRADMETGAVLSGDDIAALASFAQTIGLNIYLGHVAVYYGTPRVTIDGYYYLARKQGSNISVVALPATAEEHEIYQVPKENYFYIARGWVDGEPVHEVGLGIVTKEEITEMSKKLPAHKRYPVVSLYPQRMAEKRAEWQFLRKLIPLKVKEEVNHG